MKTYKAPVAEVLEIKCEDILFGSAESGDDFREDETPIA